MTDEPRFGKTRFATIRRDFGKLRTAIRAHDSFATEAAWEKCERWMEALPTKEQAAHIAAQDAKIANLVEVAHKVPERWAWGSGPNYQRRVCSDCGAIGELGSWDAPLPHNELCTYAQARQALASIGETDD